MAALTALGIIRVMRSSSKMHHHLYCQCDSLLIWHQGPRSYCRHTSYYVLRIVVPRKLYELPCKIEYSIRRRASRVLKVSPNLVPEVASTRVFAVVGKSLPITSVRAGL